MGRKSRYLVLALAAMVGAGAFCLRPGPPVTGPVPAGTVEPTLPLLIDLRILPGDPPHGLQPRLQATLDASDDLSDVALSLDAPADAGADPGPFAGDLRTSLKRGERRVYDVPLGPRREGSYPLRLLASFQIPDGRVLRTQQGVLWRSAAAGAEGRHHAGAYEWMATPVTEPLP